MTGGRNPARPIRVGVAGLGFGLDVHVPGFRGIPDVEVVALLGRDPDRARQAATRTGVPVLTDVGQWLDHRLDAVSIALPPGAIEAVMRPALDRGLPILAEKPLAPSAAIAREFAAQAAGRASATDFLFAELETFSALRNVVADGTIGAVRHVSIVWLTESWAHRSGTWSWKTDADRHGGVLTLLGSHLFYLAEWLFGPITRLSARNGSGATARLRPSPEARAAEDLVHLLLEHGSGVVVSAVIGNANPGLAVHRWIVSGERGAALLENTTRDYAAGFALQVTGRDGRTILALREPATDGDGRLPPFQRLAGRFIAAVRTGGGLCRPNFADGARVEALTDAARRSASTNTPIGIETWPAELGGPPSRHFAP